MTLNELLEVMWDDYKVKVIVEENCEYAMCAGKMNRVIKQYILAREIDHIDAPCAGCIQVHLK